MGQTLKHVGAPILPTVSTNNKPVPDLMGGDYIWKFSNNRVDLWLESDQVYGKAYL